MIDQSTKDSILDRVKTGRITVEQAHAELDRLGAELAGPRPSCFEPSLLKHQFVAALMGSCKAVA